MRMYRIIKLSEEDTIMKRLLLFVSLSCIAPGMLNAAAVQLEEKTAAAAVRPALEQKAAAAKQDNKLFSDKLYIKLPQEIQETIDYIADNAPKNFESALALYKQVHIEHHGNTACATAISSDGTKVVTVSRDGTAHILERRADGQWATAPIERHGGTVWSVAISSDGTRVVTASV